MPDVAEILSEAEWLTRLARSLTGSAADADDVVQDTFATALRSPPDPDRPVRPWLRRVVTNIVRMRHRGRVRRGAREAVIEQITEPMRTPEQLLERARVEHTLSDLVLALEEPYRTTVLLRYREGHSAETIAEQQGVPAGTVRWRLKTGIDRLRARLDECESPKTWRASLDANARDRKRWAPAMLVFTNGGMQVAKSTKLVLVVVVALLLASATTAIVVLPLRGGGGGTAASTRSPETTASSGAATDARTPLGPVSEHRMAERAAMLAAIASARDAREHRTAAPTRAPTTPGAPPTIGSDSSATTLDLTDNTGDTSDWEKRSLGTLNHLLGQCYDLGRAEDANLAGIVVLQFTIVGEPNIGGLLEHVEILDANTTITQKTIRDCFTEQLYALELDPPPDGVTVKRELHLKVP